MNQNLSLKPIKDTDHTTLLVLMQRIYPPAYKHLWQNQDCNWYINSQYGLTNFIEELEDPNANYFFVEFTGKQIGILRLVHETDTKSTKLHRLYLDQDYQGLGLGKKAMQLAENNAKTKNSHSIWLEVMDTQLQAIQFYKKTGFIIQNSHQLNFDLIHPQLRGMYKMTKQL